VIQASMAGVQDDVLALAVARAGGLGSVPCAMLDVDALRRLLERLAPLALPINLNFFCHRVREPDPAAAQRWREALAPYRREWDVAPPDASAAHGTRRPIDAATVDLLERYRPAVLSFHFGLPAAPLLRRIKAWGATVLASATTFEEGRWLEQHGADIVIAQGIEAGGHRGHFLSPDLSLQPEARTLVARLRKALDVPVVAAGAIGARADVVAMLEAGASAVQVGTAYLLCPEATPSAVHRAALRESSRATALTNLFSGRPARGIVNRLMRELGPLSDLPPEFPWAAQELASLRTRAEAAGCDDFSPLWSGTTHCRDLGTAEAVTRELGGMA
jgi:nitronate monooxygenase